MKSINKILILIFGIIFGLSITIINYNSSFFQANNGINLEDKKVTLKSASGDWEEQITKPVGGGPSSVFIGDANNDGYNDIVTANYHDHNISILLWNENIGDWDSAITKSIGLIPVLPESILIVDANNDGYNDIATLDTQDEIIVLLLWNNTLDDWNLHLIPLVDPFHRFYIADANNDGYNDIIASSNPFSILLWNASSNDWDPPITRPSGDFPYDISIADANNDGLNDIVTIDEANNIVIILLWNASSNDWDPQITKSVGDFPYSLFIGDADNDGLNDIVIANIGSEDISIFLWNTSLSDWDAQITKSMGTWPIDVFIGDANNDGLNEIITANEGNNDVSIWLWSASSNDWEPQVNKSTGLAPWGVFIGDANNDGLNDIVTANNDDDTVSILLWNFLPSIKINTPSHNDFFGKTTPTFNVEIMDQNLDTMWYTLNNGVNNYTFTSNGTIDEEAWESLGNGTITIKFYANDTMSKIGSAEVMVRKDIFKPIITIYEPKLEEEFIDLPPIFNISINEPNLDSIWYTIDEGQTNVTITELMGVINKDIWKAAPAGHITIRFYAQDKAGNIGSNLIIVIKKSPPPGIPIELIIIISSISGGAVIGVASILLIRRKRKRIS
ncbi:MAG: FG-GAP repeat domain-containing protein [Candidatus Odinarchaeota archaeon]